MPRFRTTLTGTFSFSRFQGKPTFRVEIDSEAVDPEEASSRAATLLSGLPGIGVVNVERTIELESLLACSEMFQKGWYVMQERPRTPLKWVAPDGTTGEKFVSDCISYPPQAAITLASERGDIS